MLKEHLRDSRCSQPPLRDHRRARGVDSPTGLDGRPTRILDPLRAGLYSPGLRGRHSCVGSTFPRPSPMPGPSHEREHAHHVHRSDIRAQIMARIWPRHADHGEFNVFSPMDTRHILKRPLTRCSSKDTCFEPHTFDAVQRIKSSQFGIRAWTVLMAPFCLTEGFWDDKQKGDDATVLCC